MISEHDLGSPHQVSVHYQPESLLARSPYKLPIKGPWQDFCMRCLIFFEPGQFSMHMDISQEPSCGNFRVKCQTLVPRPRCCAFLRSQMHVVCVCVERKMSNANSAASVLCAPAIVEMRLDISQELFCVEIHKKVPDANPAAGILCERLQSVSQEPFCGNSCGKYHTPRIPPRLNPGP